MNRLLVAVLAAVDAVVAAVIGLGVVLVPLVLGWFTAFSGADWASLWPTGARIWQLGNLVPLHLSLDDLFVASSGVAADAAGFVVSLAPLALAGFVPKIWPDSSELMRKSTSIADASGCSVFAATECSIDGLR